MRPWILVNLQKCKVKFVGRELCACIKIKSFCTCERSIYLFEFQRVLRRIQVENVPAIVNAIVQSDHS